jgi:uncharacterized protein
MKNRASSFPADAVPPAWYRQRWPWLLVAGPFLVVVASLASAWIAVKSDDGVVADDYYRQGLLINQKLARAAPAEHAPGATISVGADRGIRIHLYGVAQTPSHLQLTLARPGEHREDHRVSLAPVDGGEWVGAMPDLVSGRWIVTLESEMWRLPVTTVASPLREMTLGVVAGHS